MGKVKLLSMVTVMMAAMVWGCAGVTARGNRHTEAHVKYHASHQLDCEEASLTATCLGTYQNGECYQFEIKGCDKVVFYQRTYGSEWQPGS